MLSRVVSSVMDHLSTVDAVLKEVVDCPSLERSTSANASVPPHLALGDHARCSEVLKQSRNIAEIQIALKDVSHCDGFCFVYEQLAGFDAVAKGNGATHPHAFG